jgi:hypothetical protein
VTRAGGTDALAARRVPMFRSLIGPGWAKRYCAMAAIDRRARPELLLVGGVALGAVLAVLTTRPGGVLVAAMPFILAALTGVAKTTTA